MMKAEVVKISHTIFVFMILFSIFNTYTHVCAQQINSNMLMYNVLLLVNLARVNLIWISNLKIQIKLESTLDFQWNQWMNNKPFHQKCHYQFRTTSIDMYDLDNWGNRQQYWMYAKIQIKWSNLCWPFFWCSSAVDDINVRSIHQMPLAYGPYTLVYEFSFTANHLTAKV